MPALKVLVIEDSSAMRSLITESVEDLDLTVVQAKNGFEALRLLPAHRFEMIITDINMPAINGLEFVSFVKGSDAYRAIPVIIVTTETAAADRRKGLALGAAAYVTKPFDPEFLKSTVTQVLKNSRPSTA